MVLLVAAVSVGQTANKNNAKTITKPLSTSPKSKLKQIQSKPAPQQSLIVSGFNVYARENPSATATVIDQLIFGVIVRATNRSESEETIADRKAFWHKVVLPNGKTGWIFGAFLKVFETARRENIYKQITAEKFKVPLRSFDENRELYEFLTKAQSEVKTPGVAAQIGLWRLLALKNTLGVIPFDNLNQPPYKDFAQQNSLNVVYNEPGGQWLVRSDRFWSLAKRYANLPIGEKIAWEAANNGLPGECEGYLNCYLYLLRVTYGEYLERYPKGAHSAESLKLIEDSLQPIVEDAEKKQIYNAPVDVSDRAEFYKSVSELRTIISRTGFFEKEAVLRLLDQIAEGYR